jgi:spermidine/putrescine transport system substrate-binding protein
MVTLNPRTNLFCRTCLPNPPQSQRSGGSVAVFAWLLLSFLVGCDKTPPVAKVPIKEEEKKVVVINFDQYFAPKVLEAFTARTGIAVEVKTIESTDELQQLLRAAPDAYDVIITEESAITDLSERRLLLPLDPALVPHKKANIDPQYLRQPCDPDNQYTVPYLWGTTLVAYRKDHFPTPPRESLDLLFDPSLKGKVSLLDERNECYMMALLKAGEIPAAAQAEQFEVASGLVRDLIVKHEARFGSDNQMKEHLLSGESSVALMYSGDAAIIAQDNPNISFFIPSEGATIWIDYCAIPRDTPRPKNAHLFIDFLTEKEIAAESSNFLRYASPNLKAGELIDADLLSDRTIYPSVEVRKRCAPIPAWTPEQQRLMNDGWKIAQEAENLLQSRGATIPSRTNAATPPAGAGECFGADPTQPN